MNDSVSYSQKEYNFRNGFVFEFEDNFDVDNFFKWTRSSWHYSIYISLVYAVAILTGRKLMERKPKYELRRPLIFWNFILALFSIVGTIRGLPEVYYAVSQHGFLYSVCDTSGKSVNRVAIFWLCLFMISKVIELGDTAFIVLRKQNLIFLHWYHHITVLINVWFSIAQENASGRWFVTVNITVHSFMYTYFFFRSLGFKIPKAVSVFVTSLQLVQMAIGCFINYTAYKALQRKEPCVATMENIAFSTVIYFSYLLLFASFFWTAYLSNSDKKSMVKQKQLANGLKKSE